MAKLTKKRAASAAAMPNRLRVIGGRWRGRRISFPPLPSLRPSPDRVRETLFNWLQPVIAGARCLDLFAGSGALGIEALSRGAAHAVFVDSDRRVTRHLQETLRALGVEVGVEGRVEGGIEAGLEVGTGTATVLTADALKFLRGAPQPFDIVFLDPPYGSAVLPEACELLGRGGWLGPNALIYVECPANVPLPALPGGWSVYRTRHAGQVGYHLLQAVEGRP